MLMLNFVGFSINPTVRFYSNTTYVNVKRTYVLEITVGSRYSNTTYVNVKQKLIQIKQIKPIQIQPMLMLNPTLA